MYLSFVRSLYLTPVTLLSLDIPSSILPPGLQLVWLAVPAAAHPVRNVVGRTPLRLPRADSPAVPKARVGHAGRHRWKRFGAKGKVGVM